MDGYFMFFVQRFCGRNVHDGRVQEHIAGNLD
jgi:hypothetical protein